ncbi:hypothetical protein [Jannaschia sp. LMIT008]|uniref:hypothetical protein n=1 Tax=Jannaschia maritima TaxID=3032585 RepID=UPI002811831D|nr:hypothetical protein [Jannaschia sp. LMIT008]
MIPTKTILAGALVAVLSGCGGGGPPAGVAPGLTGASTRGPVADACLRSDRRASGPALCGCIQQAANIGLSRGDQTRAAGFFRDPHEAQVVRQSDRGRDEAFWQRYKGFVELAERSCRA